jgi:hypothetical protein
MDYEKQVLAIRLSCLETFMEAVCSRLKCLPDYNDSLPTKGNSHVIAKLDALLKTAESPATPSNTARDAIVAFNKWADSDKYESTPQAGFMFGYAAGSATKAPVA